MLDNPRDFFQGIHVGLGFGGVFEGKEREVLSEEDYVRSVHLALSIGYRFFDTAEAYSGGQSESILGKALGRHRQDVVVATKVSPENLSPLTLLKSAEDSLRRLRTDYIDLYQVHWPNPGASPEQTAEGLSLLLEKGLVKRVGVCNYSPRQLRELWTLLPAGSFVSSQVELSLVDRFQVPRSLAWAEQNGLVTLAYSPLGKGRLFAGEKAALRVTEVAEEVGATPAQVVLRWLAESGSILPIPASRNPDHMEQNFGFMDFEYKPATHASITSELAEDDVAYLSPSDIRVAIDGDGGRSVYTTLEQAVENKLDFCPSPAELSEELLRDSDIKPIRVQFRGGIPFLVEGRVRYWAWVIAHGDELPIPALVVADVVS